MEISGGLIIGLHAQFLEVLLGCLLINELRSTFARLRKNALLFPSSIGLKACVNAATFLKPSRSSLSLRTSRFIVLLPWHRRLGLLKTFRLIYRERLNS